MRRIPGAHLHADILDMALDRARCELNTSRNLLRRPAISDIFEDFLLPVRKQQLREARGGSQLRSISGVSFGLLARKDVRPLIEQLHLEARRRRRIKGSRFRAVVRNQRETEAG